MIPIRIRSTGPCPGFYWILASDLISFVLFMLVPPRPAYAALILAAAIYIALFGPRDREPSRRLTPGAFEPRRCLC